MGRTMCFVNVTAATSARAFLRTTGWPCGLLVSKGGSLLRPGHTKSGSRLRHPLGTLPPTPKLRSLIVFTPCPFRRMNKEKITAAADDTVLNMPLRKRLNTWHRINCIAGIIGICHLSPMRLHYNKIITVRFV